MKKAEYLAQVQDFVAWMARHLHRGSQLKHHYRRPGQANAVQFANLADAMDKYEWPIAAAVRGAGNSDHSLDANTLVLARLQAALKAARTDDEARDACIAVMQWGGVVNGNVDWLKKNTTGLHALLENVSALLREDDDNPKRLPANLRFNAGMTKVYSLKLDNFIIYDSRVAAALCWFITHWAIERKAAQIPEPLRFPCMPAKEGDDPEIRKVRNPSSERWQFPRLNRPCMHAHWNLRASWLLEAILELAGPDTVFAKSSNRLRALEAALFMWGYDLGRNLPGIDAAGDVIEISEAEELAPPEADDIETSALVSGGYELSTLARRRKFFWHFNEENDLIITGNNNAAQNQLTTTQMFYYLHALYERFDWGAIPLANNLDYLRDIDSAPDGLGTTLLSLLEKPLPLASRLGAILVALGQLSWNHQPKNITFQFNAPPPADIETLRRQLSAYAR